MEGTIAPSRTVGGADALNLIEVENGSLSFHVRSVTTAIDGTE